MSRSRGFAAERARSHALRIAALLTFSNGFIDAYTYFVRGGVFANVQTANVVFFAIDASQRHWSQALARLWPVLAFAAGVALAAHLESGRLDRLVRHPLRWAVTVQAAVLGLIGTMPSDVPHEYLTVPISLLAGTQIGLFRTIGDLSYMPVATTGNLMRLVQAGYHGFAEGSAADRSAFGVYCTVLGCFAGGAFLGALVSLAVGIHAVWIAAALLAAIVVDLAVTGAR